MSKQAIFLTGMFFVNFFALAYSEEVTLYDNSIDTGSWFAPSAYGYSEVCDYGQANAGTVTKIRFAYVTTLFNPGNITVRFYSYVTAGSDPGSAILQLNVSGLQGSWNGGAYIFYKDVELSENQQFSLFNGQSFGYSFEYSNSNTGAALARGGNGNQNQFWVYDDWVSWWYMTSFGGSPWAGCYLQLYQDLGPPIEEITCDISGYKFDDVDGNGDKDPGEPYIPGWEIYLDENGNGIYDTSEPNVITDPNGMYFFENIDAPATYRVREVMKDGWTQTLPGAPDNEYVIIAEPNNIYGPYDFGNTDQLLSEITISGYIKEGTTALEGVHVEAYQDGDTPTGRIDSTDSQGYYELQLSSPWTGKLVLRKHGYLFDTTINYSGRDTDITENINGTFLYGGGEGSQPVPFEIWTAEQMNNIGQNPFDWDQNFILMDDINMGIYTGTQYNIIGTEFDGPFFSGVFDGNGHSITNFTYNTTADIRYVGLFGSVRGENAEIRDLTMYSPQIEAEDAYEVGPVVGCLFRGIVSNCHVIAGQVTGFSSVGGLAGESYYYQSQPDLGSIIEYCSSSCDVEGRYFNYSQAGGLVGDNGGILRYSFATGNVTGFTAVGGLAGHVGSTNLVPPEGDIHNCYATGEVRGSVSVGGLIGLNHYADIANCYSAGHVTGGTPVGGLCGENYVHDGWYFGEFFDCFWDEVTSNQGTSDGGTGLITTDMQTRQTFLDAGWDFVDETINGTEDIWRMCPDGQGYPQLSNEALICGKYGGGDGTEGNPYQIRTPSHMDQIGQNQDDWSSYFILMEDIDMSAYQGTSYHIIGTTPFVDPDEDPFLGEFDGNGHSISNFTYQTSAFELYVGLFGVINAGGVKNLKVINPNIDVPDASNVGAIAGFLGMNVKIRDCDVIGGSVIGNRNVGGVVGQTDYGNISLCSNTAAVQGYDDVGGIVGYAEAGSVVDSYSTGAVTANFTCGGLVGDLFRYARITRCYSTGLVSGAPGGGLVGNSSGTSIRCFWDINTSNQGDSAEGIGLPTADLKQIDTFAGWGCPQVWVLDVAIAYPRLERENTPGVPLPIPAYESGSGDEESPYLIYTAEQFNDIGRYECHQTSHFKLMADIALDPDIDDNYYMIGPNYSFYGVFDGNHHKIFHPRYSQEDPDVRFIGIFSAINGLGDNNAVVKNLGVEDPVITSAGIVVGGLAGTLYKGTIENCYVKGGSITGAEAVGGLVGTAELQSSNLIRNSYSNTTVSGSAYVGGLAGYFTGGTIEFGYAAGSVSDSEYAGGLTGYYDPDRTTVTSSFYDTETTGQSGGQGVAISTEDMQTITTYAGWDFGNLWTICEGTHYPRFRWQVLPGDFVCPEGVELADLMLLSEEWLAASPLPSVDIAPQGAPDGKANLLDYSIIAENWLLGTD